MFKIVGVVAGFMVLGFPGAVIGFFIGAAIDRNIAYGAGAINPFSNPQRQAVFIETLFLLKGKLAKADGQISQAEVDHTEDVIRQLGMTAEHRKLAIDLFRQGAAPDFDHAPKVNDFLRVCGHTHNLKQMLLVYLIVLALADGRIDAAEEALLAGVAQQLGYSREMFARLMEMVLSQSGFAGGDGSRPVTASALEEAYKALGVSPDSTDQEIKRAYRKLMSQYHPDKLMGQGLPEDMIAVATQQAQEVQVAYDLITRSRQQHA